ncbi:hypothetical protein BJY04DRAFT_226035 [Aspergillus karnatakaensis]|uniref:Zn(II)2Cys6 transcription factor domain-containing protein n=1 Tax=Aspergillus karnatakaensis TaxID=1810916 RepID=UPI003CCDA84B
MLSSKRRQNTSCDPCRRAKRRCYFSASENGLGDVACANCKTRGRSCTFAFAASKLNDRRSRRLSLKSHQAALADSEDHDPFSANPDLLASWLDMDAGQSTLSGGDLDPTERVVALNTCFSPSCKHDTGLQAQRQKAPYTPEDRASLLALSTPQHLANISSSSPICLLNTKLSATVLDQRLAQVHNTIVSGCASRFVDFDCNLYATTSRYRLADGDDLHPFYEQSSHFPNMFPEGIVDASRPVGIPSQSPQPDDPGYHMTVLGVVRFLDHFGRLYGNRLSASARSQSDAVLKAVLRIFSMQWLSTSETEATATPGSLTAAFHDAWFHARALLQNAQYIRSFRVLYAILLFEGISIPREARNSVPAHKFLGQGLTSLQYLNKLIQEYCSILGPHSMYSSLLKACLSVVCWGGYIRDIGAALVSDHCCRLPCASPPSGLKSAVQLTLSTNRKSISDLATKSASRPSTDQYPDNVVPAVCRRAVAEAFHAWKQITDTKELISSGVSTSQICDAASSAVIAVTAFNDTFSDFIKHCIKNLERLSTASKVSSISIILFWNLSILILAESVLQPTTNIRSTPTLPIRSTIISLQAEATSTITRISQHLLSLPLEETFNIHNGLSSDVPIIAYHITPSLTATVFEKAIEAIVSQHLSAVSEKEQMMDDSWKHQVDTLMKVLSSLDATIGGEQASRTAIGFLMRQYADTLMECWSESFET